MSDDNSATSSRARALSYPSMPPSSTQPRCTICASFRHDSRHCDGKNMLPALEGAIFHALEPYARFILKTGVPENAPCCEKHAQKDFATRTKTTGRVIQHRNLMPMCVLCVANTQQDFARGLPPMAWRSSIDTCFCAARILEARDCQWCVVDELCENRSAYIKMCEVKIDNPVDKFAAPVPYLKCKCGGVPMGTPNNEWEWPREVMRYCAGCAGVVNVPLHHLDGETHLNCPAGRVSLANLDDHGMVAGNALLCLMGVGVHPDRKGDGVGEECFAHPVLTVTSPPFWSPVRKDSVVGSPTPLKRSPAVGKYEEQSPGPSNAGSDHQRLANTVPPARLIPSSPVGIASAPAGRAFAGNSSMRGRLNPGYRFPPPRFDDPR